MAHACGSVSPIVPIVGCENTTCARQRGACGEGGPSAAVPRGEGVRRRDVCILELCVGRAAKDAVGEAAAGGNRDGRQLEAGGGGVAEAVEAGDARLLRRPIH